MSNWAQLPHDMIIEITLNCDIKDIQTLSTVNSKFNTVINTDSFWKQKFINHYELSNKIFYSRSFDDINYTINKIGWKKYFLDVIRNYGKVIILI
jgi:hypothetical protein